MSSENVLNLEKCFAVLVDVAGTTTSNDFIKETLFSYVSKQAEDYLKDSWEDETLKEAVKYIKDDPIDLEKAIALVNELTLKKCDNKGLKIIQGLIYKKGYESGELKAHVFSDVPKSFESWAKTRKVAIYSTGSVESQRLLFTHTSKGDLSSHISKYFDQGIGDKTESGSYVKIAKELAEDVGKIIFITDNIEEAKAAKSAGLITALIVREGNDPLPADASKEFPIISSFEEVVFDKPSAKRKNVEESVPTQNVSSKSRKYK